MSNRTLNPALQALGLLRSERSAHQRTEPPATPAVQKRKPGYVSARPRTSGALRPSTQSVHRERQQGLIVLLSQFGHLRSHEVAQALFRRTRYGHQLAHRLLRAAAKGNLVLPRKNALGTTSWVLAARGVAQLELLGHKARHGRDIVGVAGATFLHRTLATQYLLHRTKGGASVFGEYAIAHGLAPIGRQVLTARFNKLPDGLVCYGTDKGPAVDVVEVEASSKPLAELVGVLGWAK
jgi:hypothetical protein